MKTYLHKLKVAFVICFAFTAFAAQAQTNVYDNVIATSDDHTYLKAAIDEAGLANALRNPMAELTIFAPTNTAFDNLAAQLNTDIPGLLELANLEDILLYHVAGSEVMSEDLTNGQLITPLNDDNTVKMTVTADNAVFANHAQVVVADLAADNGVVHSMGAVLMPNETVVDIAINGGFEYLTAAVVTAELLPTLTNPFAEFTVFAPTDDAFANLAQDLDTDVAGLLELSNLADILTYHVLGSEVSADMITNGDIVPAVSTTNTLKLTKTGDGDVYVNHAMVTGADNDADNGTVHVIDAVVLPATTVVDVALDNGFTTLATAVVTAELLPALTNPFSELTVFAPSNDAFDNLATALNTDVAGLLELENLADILTYHVLGSEVAAEDITNGDVVEPLSETNSLKLTVTGSGSVYVNQAMVSLADVAADNGIVHVLDAVVLPNTTVVDVALDNGFTTLATAVITAELLPALTDPFAELTVFAPSNDAFDNLATALNTDVAGLLELENLADILTYHVLGTEVEAAAITNGDVVSPLSTTNTLKLTVTADNEVYVNQAMVSLADVTADNGIVHVLDAVVLPSTTVVDVALDNGFSTLATAVITAELLPALSNPFATLTVFAPTNEAFETLAQDLDTDIAGLLELENLADILLYHVVGTTVLSTELESGQVETLNETDLFVDLTDGVKINNATVTTADVPADNGVVHIINAVLDLNFTSIFERKPALEFSLYPNPSTDFINIQQETDAQFQIISLNGAVVMQGNLVGNDVINVKELDKGSYIINIQNEESASTVSFIKE